MAIRWRGDGGILICAAMSEPMENDVYFDDHQHYHLSINEIIRADDNHKENGLWVWNMVGQNNERD